MIEKKTLPCSIHSAVCDFSYKPTLYILPLYILPFFTTKWWSSFRRAINQQLGSHWMELYGPLVGRHMLQQNKSKPSQTTLIKKFKGISSLCHKFWFSYQFASQCRRPYDLRNTNSVWIKYYKFEMSKVSTMTQFSEINK